MAEHRIKQGYKKKDYVPEDTFLKFLIIRQSTLEKEIRELEELLNIKREKYSELSQLRHEHLNNEK